MTASPNRTLTAKQWIGVWAVLGIGVIGQNPAAWPGAVVVLAMASLLALGFEKFNQRSSLKQKFYGTSAFSALGTVMFAALAVFFPTTSATVLFSVLALLSIVSAGMMFAFGWCEP